LNTSEHNAIMAMVYSKLKPKCHKERRRQLLGRKRNQ